MRPHLSKSELIVRSSIDAHVSVSAFTPQALVSEMNESMSRNKDVNLIGSRTVTGKKNGIANEYRNETGSGWRT